MPALEALDRAAEEEALDESLREELGLDTLAGTPLVVGVAQPRHAPVRADARAQRGPSIAVEERATATFEPALASELATGQAIRAAPAPTHTAAPVIEALDGAAAERQLDEDLMQVPGLDVRELAAFQRGVTTQLVAWQARPRRELTIAALGEPEARRHQARAGATTTPAQAPQMETGTERRKANHERFVRAASQPRRHSTLGPAARAYRRVCDALGSTEAEKRILERAETESEIEAPSGSTIVRERRRLREPRVRTAPTRTRGPLDRLVQWIAPKTRSDDDLIENALRTILQVLIGSRPAYTPPEPPQPVTRAPRPPRPPRSARARRGRSTRSAGAGEACRASTEARVANTKIGGDAADVGSAGRLAGRSSRPGDRCRRGACAARGLGTRTHARGAGGADSSHAHGTRSGRCKDTRDRSRAIPARARSLVPRSLRGGAGRDARRANPPPLGVPGRIPRCRRIQRMDRRAARRVARETRGRSRVRD